MIDCATIKDLLPLYVDDVLSRESKALISGHLATCESCKIEFLNMQSEIKKLQPDNDEKIDLLKGFKKKIFKQKVMVAGMVSVAAVALICFIFLIKIPVSYDNVKAEIVEIISTGSGEHWWWGGVPIEPDERGEDWWLGGIPDKSTMNSTNLYLVVYLTGEVTTVSKDIMRDGEIIRVVYFRRAPTAANWISDFISVEHHPTTQIWLYGRAKDEAPKKVEVYYLSTGLGTLSALADEQFDTERFNATLLWSGEV